MPAANEIQPRLFQSHVAPAALVWMVLDPLVALATLAVCAVALDGPFDGRYLILGLLAIWYGDLALEYMRTNGRVVALALAGLIVLAAIVWWLISRRRRTTS